MTTPAPQKRSEETSREADPRLLYLHGFASGPASMKGLCVSAHFAEIGVDVERLDLRVPSFERLRLSLAIAKAGAAIVGDGARAIVFGSSLGGLTAARLAERDPRVVALVLLAPAFRFAARWRANMGERAFERYRATGWIETEDFHEKRTGSVDFGFFEDALGVDDGGEGLPLVRVPTLIVHGTRDAVVGIDVTRQWAAGKRHVRLVEVDDGHALAASIPRILEEATAFLAPLLPPSRIARG